MSSRRPSSVADAGIAEDGSDGGGRKVSMSLDAEVLAQTRERIGGRGVSAYVNGAVRRQLRRDALAEVPSEMRHRRTRGSVHRRTRRHLAATL